MLEAMAESADDSALKRQVQWAAARMEEIEHE